jgi:hypothetical protein
MTISKQMRLKDLTLRFAPDVLTSHIQDREGKVHAIPMEPDVPADSKYYYVFERNVDLESLGERPDAGRTDEDRLVESKVTRVSQIVGFHNGSWLGTVLIDTGDQTELAGSEWYPRLDDELIVIEMPETRVLYHTLLTAYSDDLYGLRVQIQTGTTEAGEPVHIELWLRLEEYGHECYNHSSGSYAVFHLLDTLTDSRFAFSVSTAEQEIVEALDTITANPKLLLDNFPECVELTAIAGTVVQTTWNTCIVPYNALQPGEARTGTDTTPNFVSLLEGAPSASVDDQELEDEDADFEGSEFDHAFMNSDVYKN